MHVVGGKTKRSCYLQSSLFLCPIIHRLSDDIPSAIDIAQISAVNGCGGSQGQHDGPQWRHLIIDLARLLYVTCLECDLKTAASHAKSHRVHVDMIRQCRTLLDSVLVLRVIAVGRDCGVNKRPGCIFVMEDGHVDCNFGSAASSDVGG